MKILTSIAITALTVLSAGARENPYWLGADISGTTSMESRGTKFYNARGEERENTALMKELGLNAVRLRVWVDPRGGFSSKEDVLKMAKRAKEQGMEIMLCFHYSDSWADPAKQPIPKAWEKYTYKRMKKALAKHTEETLRLLKDNDIDVKWVQIGNETTHGMLWNVGRAETNMEQYAGLTDAGYEASKKVYPEAICIVHLDCGADIDRYHKIFDGLNKYNARYDMIGMSVYPYWDLQAKRTQNEYETLQKVTSNIKQLSKEYGKDVMIVETGYEAKRPKEGYAFMRKLIDSTKEIEQCHGVFYWAPELEHFYPLGAFDNQRPTMILDAFTEASQDASPQDTTFYSTRVLNCKGANGCVGGKLYLPYTSPCADSGRLPIVVLAHGANESQSETSGYALCLAKNGIAAYTFDFDGNSKATGNNSETADMLREAESITLEAITESLSTLPNIDSGRIILLGCGEGAIASNLTSSKNPERYRGQILLYPPLSTYSYAEKALESINKDPILLIYGDEDATMTQDAIERVKSANNNLTVSNIKVGQHGFPNAFNHRLAENTMLEFVRKLLKD
ncbi:MAG: glycosyl hydrolase 53 family protein [Muribaculum sp.]|nr:glycosyl hydrolase 53 family protein [Muribaculum sp.]